MGFRLARLGSVLPLLCAFATTAAAQTGANVLVIANSNVTGSVRIAERYAERRAVPADQILRVQLPDVEEISRADFERRLQGPIEQWLSAHQAQDRILYLVLTKGLPLRVGGTRGRNGTLASVDSELALLYRRMIGATFAPNGSIPNPYFLGDRPIADAARFTHAAQDIYLVTRLDGYTVDDALALIERATSPVASGRVLLDERATLNDRPNDWMAAAAKRLGEQGLADRVTLDTTSRVLDAQRNVLGYFSWGSSDPANTLRRPDIQFVPGAIAGMLLSSDARTFKEPPDTWKPGRSGGAPGYAGTSQSLIGDWIRSGVTGIAGQVSDPFVDGALRPDVLFPAYLAGFNLAEAYYLAIPNLSWSTIVIGDPLCRPIATGPAIDTAALDPKLDESTELPSLFSARRLAAADVKATAPGAGALVLRGKSRQFRGDLEGARTAYAEALKLDDSLNSVWRLLATLSEEMKRFDEADEIYRKLIARDSKDVVALNNLAYSLAVRHNKVDEALPMAERAYLLAPRTVSVIDTLGWIRHLAGNDADAAKILGPAAAASPDQAEVQLHAAVVFAAIGRLEDARTLLKRAETADPAIKNQPEFAATQSKIK